MQRTAQVREAAGHTRRIATLAGVGVHLHASLAILVVWAAFYLEWASDATAVLSTLATLAAIIASVLLHELAHVGAARRLGLRTLDITLLPTGGLSRMERTPPGPWEEFRIALAGPAANGVVAACSLLLLQIAPGGAASALREWMLINALLAAVNLLPVYPMDGARMMRPAIAAYAGYSRAARIAAIVAKILAGIIGVAGLFVNPLLLLVAVFVWAGAQRERESARTRAVLAGLPVSRAMATRFRTLSPRDLPQQAVQAVLTGPQLDFPVLDRGALVGMFRRSDLIAALSRRYPPPVGELMQRDLQTTHPTDSLESAVLRLKASGGPALPVVDRGLLVGLLTLEDVGDLLATPHPWPRVLPDRTESSLDAAVVEDGRP